MLTEEETIEAFASALTENNLVPCVRFQHCKGTQSGTSKGYTDAAALAKDILGELDADTRRRAMWDEASANSFITVSFYAFGMPFETHSYASARFVPELPGEAFEVDYEMICDPQQYHRGIPRFLLGDGWHISAEDIDENDAWAQMLLSGASNDTIQAVRDSQLASDAFESALAEGASAASAIEAAFEKADGFAERKDYEAYLRAEGLDEREYPCGVAVTTYGEWVVAGSFDQLVDYLYETAGCPKNGSFTVADIMDVYETVSFGFEGDTLVGIISFLYEFCPSSPMPVSAALEEYGLEMNERGEWG